MSIALMTEAWKTALKTHPKMVLLAMCDNASEQGSCYPSISSISERCSMSERGVQSQVNFLIKKGYLERQERKGRSNLFYITNPCTWQPNPRTPCTPAPHAPPQLTTKTPAAHDITPAPHAPPPAPRAPITITQPSIEPLKNHQSAGVCDLEIDGVEKNVWQEFVKMRVRIKAPLTAYAGQLIASELDKIGGDKNAVLNQSIMNGWKGVFPIKQHGANLHLVGKQDRTQRSGFEDNDYSEDF